MEILKQLEVIPQPIIDELKVHLKELHEQKHDYSSTSKDSIYKRIKEIDNMITSGYKRMLRNDSDIENELWNETYKELRAEKDELLNKLSLIDKADDEYYRQSDLILKFCKNASKIFSNSSASDKRTICEIIGPNFTANAQNIDISLYPLFYDLIQMNMPNRSENTRFELAETQTGIKKEPTKEALDLNGGTDAFRFKLFERIYLDIEQIDCKKINSLINKFNYL